MLSPNVADALRQSGHRIVITGASGWLGRATLSLLAGALGTVSNARVHCFGSQQRNLDIDGVPAIEQRPLEAIADLPPCPTLVLHLAFLTKDRAEAMDEDEYKAANRRISRTVLEALDTIGAEAVFVASSGAAAFADDPEASAAMRLYGSLKREDEEAFANWATEAGRKAVVTRIFNISGPHINKHGSYALASFILDALAGGPVQVRAPHDVLRGYVAIRELMSLVFALLLRPAAGAVRFDSGGAPVELGELAQQVASLLGGCEVVRPERTADRVDRYLGDDARYRGLLAEHRVVPVELPRQIAETAEFLVGFQSHSTLNGVTAGARTC